MYKGTNRVFYITCYVDIETGEFITKNNYIKKEWRILYHEIKYGKRKINTENLVNCWKLLRDSQTTTQVVIPIVKKVYTINSIKV